MEKRDQFNVFYTVDKNFLIPFTVSVTSLLVNNADLSVNIYLIHNSKDVKCIKEIEKSIFDKFGVTIEDYYISADQYANFPTSKLITPTVYNKLLIPEIVPQELKAGLYLDSDTIVTGSLKKLSEYNFNAKDEKGYYLYAVEDTKGQQNASRLHNELNINVPLYFNAGVMWLNLEKWRKENTTHQLFETANRFVSKILWHDQDILNIYFAGKCGKLPNDYNRVTYTKLPDMPTIIHFSGWSKPWHYINNGPYKNIYLRYKKMTIFRKIRTEKVGPGKVYRKYLDKLKDIIGIQSFSDTFGNFLGRQKN